jgi:hypothetical protein
LTVFSPALANSPEFDLDQFGDAAGVIIQRGICKREAAHESVSNGKINDTW